MATLLIYLSDDFDGGETVFPALRGKDGKLKPPLVLKVVVPPPLRSPWALYRPPASRPCITPHASPHFIRVSPHFPCFCPYCCRPSCCCRPCCPQVTRHTPHAARLLSHATRHTPHAASPHSPVSSARAAAADRLGDRVLLVRPGVGRPPVQPGLAPPLQPRHARHQGRRAAMALVRRTPPHLAYARMPPHPPATSWWTSSIHERVPRQ